jgi:cutinase
VRGWGGWLGVAVVGCAVVAGGMAPASAAAGGGSAVHRAWLPRQIAGGAASSCADVLFVGARGTGETGPGTPGWDPKTDPYGGLGATVYAVKQALAADLGVTSVQTLPVSYNTNNVWIMLTDTSKYFADLSAGVTFTLNHLASQATSCPHQQIVLAGYSQGAMVMHRVLHKLGGTSAGKAVLARVVGAVLVGDGDQVPGDNGVTRYGTATQGAQGVGLAFTDQGSGSSTAKFPAAVGARVVSVCDAGDPVCDWHDDDLCDPYDPGCLVTWAHLVGIHLGYASGTLLASAAAWAARQVTGVGIWAPSSPPLPAGADPTAGATLSSLSCPSVCVALGYYTSTSAGAEQMLVSGSGSAWSATTVPSPPGASFPNLTQVACASATSCVAIGSYDDASGNEQGLLVTGGGSTWSAARAPLPSGAAADPQVTLTSVTCPAVSDCVAVGYYENSQSHWEGLALTWSGSSWTAAAVPAPAGKGNVSVLNSVACQTPTACVAAGQYQFQSSASAYALVATGAGSSWTPASAPAPGRLGTPAFAQLVSVACPSASTCVAAGDYLDDTGVARVMLLTRSGTSWLPATTPLPGGGTSSLWQVLQVACATASTCVVDGVYTDATGRYQVMVISGAGSSWTAVRAPLPRNAGSQAISPTTGYVAGLACASASLCVLDGSYIDTQNNPEALLIVGSGSAWAAGAARLPAGGVPGPDTVLNAIACPTTSACTAAGSYTDSGQTSQALLTTGPG